MILVIAQAFLLSLGPEAGGEGNRCSSQDNRFGHATVLGLKYGHSFRQLSLAFCNAGGHAPQSRVP